MLLIRALLALFVLAALGACAPPPGPPVSIRPGIGQDVNLDALRPPSGVTYRFEVIDSEVPLPTELRITSRKRSAGTYDYVGDFIYSLPGRGGLEQVAEVLKQELELDDLPVRVRGNMLLIPYLHRADNRFRISRSVVNGDGRRHLPHDCLATLGTCQFTSVLEQDKTALRFESTTTEAKGVWVTRTRPISAGAVARAISEQRLTYSLDKNGVPIDLVIQSRVGSNRMTTIYKRK
jgi:hypothetical protein